MITSKWTRHFQYRRHRRFTFSKANKVNWLLHTDMQRVWSHSLRKFENQKGTLASLKMGLRRISKSQNGQKIPSPDSLLDLLSTNIVSNLGIEVTIIWPFVTVTAGLGPNANISKSIHWQFNYTVSTEKEKCNIRFPFWRSVDWTVNQGEFDRAVARNMWEQFAGSVMEQNIGRIHFGGARQLPVNVKLLIALLNLLQMPCGSQRCDTPY